MFYCGAEHRGTNASPRRLTGFLDVSVSIETLVLHKGVLKSMSNKSDECVFNILFTNFYFAFLLFFS